MDRRTRGPPRARPHSIRAVLPRPDRSAPLGGFENHDGYDGVFFALPGGAELELTAGPARPAPSTDEDLLVLYVQTQAEAEAIGARLTAAGVTRIPNRNPYWNRSGLTFLDPDGYRLVIAVATPSG